MVRRDIRRGGGEREVQIEKRRVENFHLLSLAVDQKKVPSFFEI
jgi:hypothetical protein